MAEQSWTDDPITTESGRLKEKTIHFTELQDAINAWESAYSIGNTNWSDSPTILKKINSSVITEMQNALDALLQLANFNDFSWTEKPIIRTKIKAVHINEVRDNMNIMQNDYCYLCDSCDTYTGCTCESTCYNDACDLCNYTCYARICYVYSGGVCYNDVCQACEYACYIDACDQCDSSCYENTCNQCHITNYRYPWT